MQAICACICWGQDRQGSDRKDRAGRHRWLGAHHSNNTANFLQNIMALRQPGEIMIIRSGLGSVACNLCTGLLMWTVAAGHSPAHAQSAAGLAHCDRVAADPADPDKCTRDRIP
jgi:hypothetical protein